MLGDPPPLRIATRGSALALWQAEHVAALLGGARLVVVETFGDRRTDIPVWEMGGQGVFVKEVQAAVLDGRADLAVHSAKDLPSETAPGLVLAAVPERDDPRDALVGSRLAELPPGARIGTGSVRRRAQLASLRPDLTFGGLRGNIGTRLARADGFDAVVMAAAALRRLGEQTRITEVLDPTVMLPQVAQGALGIECRADDERTRALLSTIEDLGSRRAVDAERAFLAELGSGCNLPVGAHATTSKEDEAQDDDSSGGAPIRLAGLLATLDGRILLRAEREGDDPVAVGRELAHHLLHRAGGSLLVDDLQAAPTYAVPPLALVVPPELPA